MRKFTLLCLVLLSGSSCVTMKTYNEKKAEAIRLGWSIQASQKEIDKLTAQTNSVIEEKDKIVQQTQTLSEDKQIAIDERDKIVQQLGRQKAEYKALENQYSDLKISYDKLLGSTSAEAGRMLKELEKNQTAISVGQDELARKNSELMRKNAELETRSQRVAELTLMLEARDHAIDNIKRQVTVALVGFEGNGIQISTHDGKVLVSLEDKLLFRSGRFDIGPEGAKAVKDLADVLAMNPDIDVLVEGHTDNVPYKGTGVLADNLDLSTKRATTVVRLLLGNKKIAPERVTAAGRGEYMPLELGTSPEARARNRRTEIYLTPKFDELIEIKTANNQ